MNRELSARPSSLVGHPITRRALAKQRTRERLLDAARQLFIERGYEAATVRDIAAAADLSTGAVFASFLDKADLFNAVLTADYQRVSQKMGQQDLAGLSVRDALLRLVGVAYDLHVQQLGLVQAAVSFAWQRDRDAEARDRQGSALILSLLAGVMARGVERNELSADFDVKLAVDMLWDCYLANLRRAIFDHWDAPALKARMAAQLDLLLTGHKAAG